MPHSPHPEPDCDKTRGSPSTARDSLHNAVDESKDVCVFEQLRELTEALRSLKRSYDRFSDNLHDSFATASAAFESLHTGLDHLHTGLDHLSTEITAIRAEAGAECVPYSSHYPLTTLPSACRSHLTH